MVYGFFVGFLVLLIGFWMLVGHPLDAPWTWWTYWSGERTTKTFLVAVERNEMTKAYGIWVNDPDWQHHPDQYKQYPYARFSEDWGPNSSANDYGTISSDQVVVRKMWGNALIVGALINGRKAKPLFLAYDSKAHTLGFSPVELSYGD